MCFIVKNRVFSKFINILGHFRGKIMTEMVHKSNEKRRFENNLTVEYRSVEILRKIEE